MAHRARGAPSGARRLALPRGSAARAAAIAAAAACAVSVLGALRWGGGGASGGAPGSPAGGLWGSLRLGPGFGQGARSTLYALPPPELVAPRSSCAVHGGGVVSVLGGGPGGEGSLPELFDLERLPPPEVACGPCSGEEETGVPDYLRCGPCQFENRTCERYYPGAEVARRTVQGLCTGVYRAEDGGKGGAGGTGAGALSSSPSDSLSCLSTFSPCELFARIRGRSLFLVGDSQSWHFFYALECYLRDFARDRPGRPCRRALGDGAAYVALSANPTLPTLCLELVDDTRVCASRVDFMERMALRTLPALAAVEGPQRWPRAIVVINSGLHYHNGDLYRADFRHLVDWKRRVDEGRAAWMPEGKVWPDGFSTQAMTDWKRERNLRDAKGRAGEEVGATTATTTAATTAAATTTATTTPPHDGSSTSGFQPASVPSPFVSSAGLKGARAWAAILQSGRGDGGEAAATESAEKRPEKKTAKKKGKKKKKKKKTNNATKNKTTKSRKGGVFSNSLTGADSAGAGRRVASGNGARGRLRNGGSERGAAIEEETAAVATPVASPALASAAVSAADPRPPARVPASAFLAALLARFDASSAPQRLSLFDASDDGTVVGVRVAPAEGAERDGADGRREGPGPIVELYDVSNVFDDSQRKGRGEGVGDGGEGEKEGVGEGGADEEVGASPRASALLASMRVGKSPRASALLASMRVAAPGRGEAERAGEGGGRGGSRGNERRALEEERGAPNPLSSRPSWAPRVGPTVLWMDTPPQHFGTATGEWGPGMDMRCRPLETWRQGSPWVLSGNGYGREAAPFLSRIADGRLRTWNASAPLFDSHKAGECTHWCSPGAYHVWLVLLNGELAKPNIGNAVRVLDVAGAGKKAGIGGARGEGGDSGASERLARLFWLGIGRGGGELTASAVAIPGNGVVPSIHLQAKAPGESDVLAPRGSAPSPKPGSEIERPPRAAASAAAEGSTDVSPAAFEIFSEGRRLFVDGRGDDGDDSTASSSPSASRATLFSSSTVSSSLPAPGSFVRYSSLSPAERIARLHAQTASVAGLVAWWDEGRGEEEGGGGEVTGGRSEGGAGFEGRLPLRDASVAAPNDPPRLFANSSSTGARDGGFGAVVSAVAGLAAAGSKGGGEEAGGETRTALPFPPPGRGRRDATNASLPFPDLVAAAGAALAAMGNATGGAAAAGSPPPSLLRRTPDGTLVAVERRTAPGAALALFPVGAAFAVERAEGRAGGDDGGAGGGAPNASSAGPSSPPFFAPLATLTPDASDPLSALFFALLSPSSGDAAAAVELARRARVPLPPLVRLAATAPLVMERHLRPPGDAEAGGGKCPGPDGSRRAAAMPEGTQADVPEAPCEDALEVWREGEATGGKGGRGGAGGDGADGIRAISPTGNGSAFGEGKGAGAVLDDDASGASSSSSAGARHLLSSSLFAASSPSPPVPRDPPGRELALPLRRFLAPPPVPYRRVFRPRTTDPPLSPYFLDISSSFEELWEDLEWPESGAEAPPPFDAAAADERRGKAWADEVWGERARAIRDAAKKREREEKKLRKRADKKRKSEGPGGETGAGGAAEGP